MFENEPTNPKLIVANILSLSDSWKELLGPEEKAAPAPKKKRAPAKRKPKAS